MTTGSFTTLLLAPRSRFACIPGEGGGLPARRGGAGEAVRRYPTMLMRFAATGALCATLVGAATSGAAATMQDDSYGSRATEFCSARKPAAAAPAPTPPRPGSKPKPGSRPNGTRPPAAGNAVRRDSVGLTLFRRATDGTPQRVDAGARFSDGDQIRLVVESNFDGYLYIFNTDSAGAKPVLIYPQVRLADGANRIAAHVPTEVPSRMEQSLTNQWLVLAGGPVTDRLVVVVTAEPLPWVPVGPDLVSYCGENRDCYWTPDVASALSEAKKLESKPDPPVASNETAGQQMTGLENEAIARTVRLGPEAPPPASIVSVVGRSTRLIVAVLDLTHAPAG